MANTPIVAAALANLKFVPVNRKVSAAGTPTATYMLTYTTAGTNGGTSSGTVNIVITFSDSVPTVAAGIAPQNVNEGGSFSYTIQVGFEPTDDFNPVDTDDANLTFTAHIVDGNTETALRLPTHTGPDTATDWLRFDPATGQFSGTPPPDAASVMVRVRAKDARDDDRYSATSTFTLTVGGRPIFTIVSVTHDSARGDAVVTVGLAEGSPPVKKDTIVTVNVTATNGYITNENGKEKTATFTAANAGNQVVRVGLDRSFGPDAMITADVVPSRDYDVSPPTAKNGEADIDGNDKAVRNSTVKEGLGGLARALGWDLTDAISRRSSQVHRGGASQVDLGSLTQRLNSKLTDRLAGLGSSDRTTANNSNEIMAIINAMNDRSLAGQSASLATHTGGYGYIGTGSIEYRLYKYRHGRHGRHEYRWRQCRHHSYRGGRCQGLADWSRQWQDDQDA